VDEKIGSLPAHSTVLEIGGGMAGYQFVMARRGLEVVNVDPGMAARGKGWSISPLKHRILSRMYRAPVTLIPTTLQAAEIADRSIDAVVSISTLEHLPHEDLEGVGHAIRRILKPGGIGVFTVDLFLDLYPFTDARQNEWGSNIDLHAFLQRAGLELVEGNPKYLMGFPQFNPADVLSQRETFLRGGRKGEALSQCLVTRSKG
jgi:hypothetical protein